MFKKVIVFFSYIGLFVVILIPIPENSTLLTRTQSTIPLKKPATITFVGDIMLDRHIRHRAQTQGYEPILADLTHVLTQSDVVVGNLEGPVTTYPPMSIGSEIKSPENFTFTFEPESLPLLYDNNIRIVSIGNNHIMNFGDEGLFQTRQFLSENTISYFGDPQENMPLVINIAGQQIGFVSYNQFLDVSSSRTLSHIQSLETQVDHTIVYAHWGNEYEKQAHETQRILARAFIEAGADLVVGAHPHVVQDNEIYNDRHIYYSLGNFIFDQYWNDDVRCGKVATFRFIQNTSPQIVDEHFVYAEPDGKTILNQAVCSSQ